MTPAPLTSKAKERGRKQRPSTKDYDCRLVIVKNVLEASVRVHYAEYNEIKV